MLREKAVLALLNDFFQLNSPPVGESRRDMGQRHIETLQRVSRVTLQQAQSIS